MRKDALAEPSEEGIPEEWRVAKVRAVAAPADLDLVGVGAEVAPVHVVSGCREVEEGHETDAEGLCLFARELVELDVLVRLGALMNIDRST